MYLLTIREHINLSVRKANPGTWKQVEEKRVKATQQEQNEQNITSATVQSECLENKLSCSEHI